MSGKTGPTLKDIIQKKKNERGSSQSGGNRGKKNVNGLEVSPLNITKEKDDKTAGVSGGFQSVGGDRDLGSVREDGTVQDDEISVISFKDYVARAKARRSASGSNWGGSKVSQVSAAEFHELKDQVTGLRSEVGELTRLLERTYLKREPSSGK